MVWPPPEPLSGVELVRSKISVPSTPKVSTAPTSPAMVRVAPGTVVVSVITRLVNVQRPTRHGSPIAGGLAVGDGVTVAAGVGLGVAVAVAVGLGVVVGLSVGTAVALAVTLAQALMSTDSPATTTTPKPFLIRDRGTARRSSPIPTGPKASAMDQVFRVPGATESYQSLRHPGSR